ncbi:VUT family protein [Propionibacterium freudenreichii]|nr:VUT family protein [Propionibacterium freudenreichii]
MSPSSDPAAPAGPAGRRPAYAQMGSSISPFMLAIMCVVIVLSGIGASKGVQFGPIITDGAFFIFPFSYILGDAITEIYGPVAARRAIIMGFIVNAVSAGIYWIIIVLPGLGDDYSNAKQSALELALGPVWQVVLAGMVGFAGGQSVNSLIMWIGKKRHQEKGLYARLASSTGLGELIDTILFCTIAAPVIGLTTLGQWANYTVVGFVYKVALQYLLMPVTARVIRVIKAHEPTYQQALAARADERPHA